MAEAIGLAASILQIAQYGLVCSRELYKFSKSLSDQDTNLARLRDHVDANSRVLQRLGQLLERHGSVGDALQNDIQLAANSCARVFENISHISSSMSAQRHGINKVYRRTKYAAFHESRIKEYREELSQAQTTLTLMMHIHWQSEAADARQAVVDTLRNGLMHAINSQVPSVAHAINDFVGGLERLSIAQDEKPRAARNNTFASSSSTLQGSSQGSQGITNSFIMTQPPLENAPTQAAENSNPEHTVVRTMWNACVAKNKTISCSKTPVSQAVINDFVRERAGDLLKTLASIDPSIATAVKDHAISLEEVLLAVHIHHKDVALRFGNPKVSSVDMVTERVHPFEQLPTSNLQYLCSYSSEPCLIKGSARSRKTSSGEARKSAVQKTRIRRAKVREEIVSSEDDELTDELTGCATYQHSSQRSPQSPQQPLYHSPALLAKEEDFEEEEFEEEDCSICYAPDPPFPSCPPNPPTGPILTPLLWPSKAAPQRVTNGEDAAVSQNLQPRDRAITRRFSRRYGVDRSSINRPISSRSRSPTPDVSSSSPRSQRESAVSHDKRSSASPEISHDLEATRTVDGSPLNEKSQSPQAGDRKRGKRNSYMETKSASSDTTPKTDVTRANDCSFDAFLSGGELYSSPNYEPTFNASTSSTRDGVRLKHPPPHFKQATGLVAPNSVIEALWPSSVDLSHPSGSQVEAEPPADEAKWDGDSFQDATHEQAPDLTRPAPSSPPPEFFEKRKRRGGLHGKSSASDPASKSEVKRVKEDNVDIGALADVLLERLGRRWNATGTEPADSSDAQHIYQ